MGGFCCNLMQNHDKPPENVFIPEQRYYTNELSSAEQNSLYSICMHCYNKAIIHEGASRKYRCVDKWVQLILKIITFALGGSSWLTLLYNINTGGDITFNIIFVSLTMINIVFSSIDAVIMPSVRSNKHQLSYLTYYNTLREAGHIHKLGISSIHIEEMISNLNSQITECEITSLPV